MTSLCPQSDTPPSGNPKPGRNKERSHRRWRHQRTLKNVVHCSGVGLHSGDPVSLVLRPGAVDSGIVFRRTDVSAHGVSIAARWDQVVNTHLRTTIGNDTGVTVSTVEHLMAAFAGCGVDNALVEIDAAETPIMDGSAAPFQFLIECAGLEEQAARRKAIRIEKEVMIEQSGRFARFRPASETILHCEIEFSAAVIARQEYRFFLREGAFKSELSRARTFGQLRDVDRLREMGLARGGSCANAVVVDDAKILNEGGLRFDNEFARHKTLDALGDLYLAGHPFIGEFYSYCSGHEINRRLLAALMADASAWSLCDIGEAHGEDSPGHTPIVAPVAEPDLPLAATA